jgi:hypothetical protein
VKRTGVALLAVLVTAGPAAADPPSVDHQPVPCTVPDQPFTVCATVTDDGEVARARVYFKAENAKFYSFVDMAFGGIEFCGTLPAPRQGRLKTVEYYVQAVDDTYETFRTSTHVIAVQPDGVCGFPPVEKDPARARSITVHATHPKQGRKLPDAFTSAGVTFVAVQAR